MMGNDIMKTGWFGAVDCLWCLGLQWTTLVSGVGQNGHL